MVFELLLKICLIVFSKSHYHLQNNSVLRDVNRGNMAVVGIIYVPEGQMDKDAQVGDTLATSKSVIHTVYHTFLYSPTVKVQPLFNKTTF